MRFKITLFTLCFLLYQITNILAGTCERQENCSNNCALICNNSTENEIINAARGFDKLIVKYGNLLSVSSLFLKNPNLLKILEISENANVLKIQEVKRPLTQEIDLEELKIEKTSLELLFDAKLFQNFGKLKKLSIHECFIERIFTNLLQYDLPNLEYLSLKSNGIVEVDMKAFTHLSNLKYVDLSQNLIKSLSYENFKRANNLQVFHLNENPLFDFNIEKFLRNKDNLWMANMHSIYCNTFQYVVMDSFKKLGYKPTYLQNVECVTPTLDYKCNRIIMKHSNNRNITIAEGSDNTDKYPAYYENTSQNLFICTDDCSTQLIDYFPEDDEYSEQLAANILQYYMGHLQKNFKEFHLRFNYMENTPKLRASLEKLHSVINVTSLQIEKKL